MSHIIFKLEEDKSSATSSLTHTHTHTHTQHACVCVCVCVLFIGIVQRNWTCLTWKSALEIKSLLLLLLSSLFIASLLAFLLGPGSLSSLLDSSTVSVWKQPSLREEATVSGSVAVDVEGWGSDEIGPSVSGSFRFWSPFFYSFSFLPNGWMVQNFFPNF